MISITTLWIPFTIVAALGQVAVDVAQIKAWAYAFTGHKWLFGPMGTGGLWTSERFLRVLVSLHQISFRIPVHCQITVGQCQWILRDRLFH